MKSSIITLFFILSAIIMPTMGQHTSPENEAINFYNQGMALYKEGKNHEAIEKFQSFIRLSPDSAAAYYNIGVIYSDAQFYPEAIINFKEALLRQPNYAEAHRNLGAVYYHLGRMQEAITEYELAIRLRKNYLLAYNDLSVLMSELGRHNEAIDIIERTVRLNPKDPITFHTQGYIYFRANQPKKAEKAFKQAIILDSDFNESRFYLGVVHLSLNNRCAAIEQYSKLKKSTPDLADELYKAIFKNQLLFLNIK